MGGFWGYTKTEKSWADARFQRASCSHPYPHSTHLGLARAFLLHFNPCAMRMPCARVQLLAWREKGIEVMIEVIGSYQSSCFDILGQADAVARSTGQSWPSTRLNTAQDL